MEKDKAIAILEAEIASSNCNDMANLIYELIVEKELDKKAIRNKVIKAEFNELYRTTMPVMDIYQALSYTHNVSEQTIMYVLSK